MARVSSRTQTGDQGRSTRLVYLAHAATVRLLEQFLMLTQRRLSENSTCLKNQNQCCDTFLACSSTRIQLSSTPPVVLEVHCERLSLLAQSMSSVSKSVPNFVTEPVTPSKKPARSKRRKVS